MFLMAMTITLSSCRILEVLHGDISMSSSMISGWLSSMYPCILHGVDLSSPTIS